jgi:hypothetical protein
MFYSPTKQGFYNKQIHGDSIPADAVEITEERHAELMAAQSSGLIIVPDDIGHPIAIDPPELSKSEAVRLEISKLEKQITARRLREAVLTTDGADWLSEMDAKIVALRQQVSEIKG